MSFRVTTLHYKLRKFSTLPYSDQFLLIKIAVLVPLVECSLHLFGFKQVARALERFATADRAVANPAADVERHRRLLFVFHQQVPFAGKCLAGSLTLKFLLKRLNIDTELKFGLNKLDGKLVSHAWVEYNSRPLTLDQNVVSQYTPFANSIVA